MWYTFCMGAGIAGRDRLSLVYHGNEAGKCESRLEETRLPLPAELGEGHADFLRLGTEIGYGALYLKNPPIPMVIDAQAAGRMAKFTVHLSKRPTVFRVRDRGEALKVGYGDGFLLSSSAHGIVYINQNEEFHEFSLFLSEKRLETLIEELGVAVDKEVTDLLVRPASDHCFVESPNDAASRLATMQLLSCAVDGPLRELYVEAKLYELLALRLQRLSGACRDEAPAIYLNRYDRRHLDEAREILLTEACDPPSIRSLARRVGLNTTKLKSGFRNVFGTTIFGFVREVRMERALKLLSEGECTVSEAAASVGYRSLSAFSSAFHRRYGVLPGTLSRRDTARQEFLTR